MAKKSNNTLTVEKNKSRNNFINCKKLNDEVYTRILNYGMTPIN